MFIETERLIVDDLRPEDKEQYFLCISHDTDVLKTFICNYAEDLETFDFAKYLDRSDLFAIREKKTGLLIGIFVECEVDRENRSLEIGYGLGSRYWGKGYMTETVTAMLSYYLDQASFQTVYASFFPENTASKRVMEKCGMTFSHVHTNELTYLGRERDLIYYKKEAGAEQTGLPDKHRLLNSERMTGMEFRRLTSSDLESLLVLYRQLDEANDPALSENSENVWKQIAENDSIRYFGAVEHGQVVSTCYAVVIPNLTHGNRSLCLIENVVTDEAYRNRGLASRVIGLAIAFAKERHCYKVILQSGKARTEAHQFYLHQGFDGTSKKAFDMRLD